MENVPFLDQSTFSTTDKICLMIHDQLIRLEEDFYNFKRDIVKAKSIEKFHDIKRCIDNFANNDQSDDDQYHVIRDHHDVMVAFDGNGAQFMISICLKHLSRERVIAIWEKLFSKEKIKTILALLDEWQEEGFLNDDHIVYCVDHDGPNEMKHMKILDYYLYSDEEVKAVLSELTLFELADIRPEIQCVRYKLLNPAT